MPYPNTSQEFLNLFNISKLGFSNVELFNETVGFSATKEFGNIGNKKILSLLRVGLVEDVETENSKVIVTITLVEDEKNQFGYLGYPANQKSITRNLPISLKSTEDFYVNNMGSFRNRDGDIIDAPSLIQELYWLHIKPTKKILGLLLRIRIVLAAYKAYYLNKLYDFNVFFLEYFTNKKFVFVDDPLMILGAEYHLNKKLIDLKDHPDLKTETGESNLINFYEYKVLKSTLFLYSFFSLLTYAFFFNLNYYPGFLLSVFSNAYLTSLFVVFTIYLFEKSIEGIIPEIIQSDLNKIFKRIQNVNNFKI